MLKEKGTQELNKQKYTKTFEGTAEITKSFSYPEDYDIGDIVEIVNEWDISSSVLISEVVLSVGTDGISVVPTFASVNDDEEVSD